jgi:hypothetical protein
MSRLRIETLSSEVLAAKRRAALIDRYGMVSLARPHYPPTADSLLDQLRALPPGRSEEAARLGLQWLAETWPAAFGADFVPIAVETFSLVNDVARKAGMPNWLRKVIVSRARSRNAHHAARSAIAAPGSYWRSLHGRPIRPITEAERRQARSSLSTTDR